ncbi:MULTISPECIES: NAD(P)-dependent oxidoreductase [Microbacterium]|uniref:NAD(P)-dependent oxidoreductase n=1 Tax=Microbacterium TaxID=33882 RepID=UPI002780E8EE|nr:MULTISPECIES: NAD(P)-dependent oxidoreductase [Microbacterium]MDQ1075138.1 3-hydroxyisobutyrate dehydrogenase-like beta-hydroxyacid dehydrogenase [Microbacterium sp. SORGH_AS_0969]MDQ1115369.1 3-hydroxyisobutyrate dehydrogenase-like beta-hydroxyacid dehydrogenase [Microbacterium testaceum]
MQNTTHTIAVVGLGNMGIEVATRLAAAWPTIGVDLSAERQTEASERGLRTAPLESAVDESDIVALSLPTPAASLAVARSLAARPGTVRTVLEMSTVTPNDMKAIQRVLEPAGIRVLDCAVLAGIAQMRAGTAGLVLAGDAAAIEEISPVLDALTAKRRVLGDVGTGMAAKVLNNAVAHGVMVMLGEVMAMAVRTGLDPRALVDILAGDDGGLLRPLTHRVAERGFTGSYDGGMSLEAARKDSVLALSMAQDDGVPVFTLPAAHGVYEMAMAEDGWARNDYAVLLRLWEHWGGFTFPDAVGPTP